MREMESMDRSGIFRRVTWIFAASLNTEGAPFIVKYNILTDACSLTDNSRANTRYNHYIGQEIEHYQCPGLPHTQPLTSPTGTS